MQTIIYEELVAVSHFLYVHSKTRISSVTYYVLGTVTTLWLNSDCVVTVKNCRQSSNDYVEVILHVQFKF